MIRVVHLFDLKSGVKEEELLNWLDARLDAATKEFGCLERHTWIFMDGFRDTHLRRKTLERGDRPRRTRYVNEAYWPDAASADRFREWLMESEDGEELHDSRFDQITNHTVLRYYRGWEKVHMRED